MQLKNNSCQLQKVFQFHNWKKKNLRIETKQFAMNGKDQIASQIKQQIELLTKKEIIHVCCLIEI